MGCPLLGGDIWAGASKRRPCVGWDCLVGLSGTGRSAWLQRRETQEMRPLSSHSGPWRGGGGGAEQCRTLKNLSPGQKQGPGEAVDVSEGVRAGGMWGSCGGRKSGQGLAGWDCRRLRSGGCGWHRFGGDQELRSDMFPWALPRHCRADDTELKGQVSRLPSQLRCIRSLQISQV